MLLELLLINTCISACKSRGSNLRVHFKVRFYCDIWSYYVTKPQVQVFKTMVLSTHLNYLNCQLLECEPAVVCIPSQYHSFKAKSSRFWQCPLSPPPAFADVCLFWPPRTPVRQPRPSRACTSARPTNTWGTWSSNTSASPSVATMAASAGVPRWVQGFSLGPVWGSCSDDHLRTPLDKRWN